MNDTNTDDLRKVMEAISDDEFSRQNRYVVFKRKDLFALTLDQRQQLGEITRAVRAYRATRGVAELECVVVESDWPMYENTWELIEAHHNLHKK